MNGRIFRILLGVIGTAAAAFAMMSGGNASFIKTQQDQQSVYILVNVTPAPVVYRPIDLAARFADRARGSAASFDALQHIELVAQAQPTQQPLYVQAEVSPNPNATLLYTNQSSVVINAVAGTTWSQSCAYTVTAHPTATTNWYLDDGLSGDFSSSFPGGDLENDTYVSTATPQPAATPFVVYPTNNNAWYKFATGTGVQTYCVDLKLTIPTSVPGGAYSTNAVYTLYF